MAREDEKRDIPRFVSRHDGGCFWYQVDRALSGSRPGCVGPFIAEILELAAEGLIEIRPNQTLGEQNRYWLTDAGRVAATPADA